MRKVKICLCTMSLMIVELLFLCSLVVYHEVNGIDTHPSVSWSHHNQTDYDYYEHYETTEYILVILVLTVIPIVAVLGVCGNVVILVVWSGESAFHPTTFLMKCLAVSDLVLLAGVIIFFVSYFFLYDIVSFRPSVTAVLCFRVVTVHTTLAVVATRWITVYRPLQVHNLLTKSRVVKGYALLMLWCLTAVLPVTLLIVGIISHKHIFTTANIVEVVYIALPILLLVVLNASLVYKVYTHGVGHDVRPENTTAPAARDSPHHRLLIAVLCVSITTVLAYPVGVASRIYINLNPEYRFLLGLFICVSVLLESFNSSINVVYYLIFISRFRQLYCRRCCCHRCHQTTRHEEDTEYEMVNI